MGESRYRIIKTKVHKEWLSDCPIKVEKSQLLFDTKENAIVLQIKMFNLSDNQIKSVFLNISTYDESMNFIQKKSDVAFLALNAIGQSVFGDRTPIVLDSLQVYTVDIIIKKVVFNNDNVWNNFEEKIGVELPEQRRINTFDELYNQVIREINGRCIRSDYWFENKDTYWRCTCGQTNSNEKNKCGYCKADKEWLEKHFDRQYLSEKNEKYKEVEFMCKKKADEETKIKEQLIRQELEEEIKKKKKTKLIKQIVLTTSIIFAIVIWLFVYNSMQFDKALQLYNEGDYKRAANIANSIIWIDKGDSNDTLDQLKFSDKVGSRYQEYKKNFSDKDYYNALVDLVLGLQNCNLMENDAKTKGEIKALNVFKDGYYSELSRAFQVHKLYADELIQLESEELDNRINEIINKMN